MITTQTISYIKTYKSRYEYYEWNYEVLRDARRHYTWYYEVLQDSTSYYKQYYEIQRVVLKSLRGTATGTRRYYQVLRVVLRIAMWYYKKFQLQRVIFRDILPKIIFQKYRYEKFYKIQRKPTVIGSFYYWNYNSMPKTLLKNDFTEVAFLWYWTTVNFEALLNFMKKTEH